MVSPTNSVTTASRDTSADLVIGRKRRFGPSARPNRWFRYSFPFGECVIGSVLLLLLAEFFSVPQLAGSFADCPCIMLSRELFVMFESLRRGIARMNLGECIMLF